MPFEWSCNACTYRHKAPGNRCVMCGNLRNASRQEMVAFIQGKSLRNGDHESHQENESTNISMSQQQNSTLMPQKANNPYLKTGSGASIATCTEQKNSSTSSTKPTAPIFQPSPSRPVATNPYAKKNASSLGAKRSAHAPLGQSSTQAANPYVKPSSAPQQAVVPSNIVVGAQQQQPPPSENVVHRPVCGQRLPPHASRPASAQSLGRPHPIASRPPSSGSKAVPLHPLMSNKPNPFQLKALQAQDYRPGPVPLDAEASKEWIYPVHSKFPIRDYQLEISQTAIQYNTLVSLPTGLGKTLIAAVVLYNFYRWFPQGKVVFLAPTLPLVDQQVKACYQIMGIPAQDTAVLNGKVSAATRKVLWQERRVFFCTPQTVEKDMEAERCPAAKVVCLVLDEAHKATGNFAYTKVVELCEAAGAHLRILGLSATPGAKVQQVQKVIDALRITRLEARSEEEVKEYIHERHNEIVLVKKRTLCHEIEKQLNALISPIMTKLRANTNIRQKIGPNDETLTSFCIHRGRQYHHESTNDHQYDGYFQAAQKLIDARANLFSHGIGSVRGKLLELQNNPQRGVLSTIVKSPEFVNVMEAVINASSGKYSQETAEDKKINNPKLLKLDEILQEHFNRSDAMGSTTRAIVFSQWRESVGEIVDVLSLSRPLIRPRHFVGQSSGGKGGGGAMKGMPQKEQQQAIREFQEGVFNVLVCTCIGEEGLDIGEVDLIVNYDTLRSPIRMIQRVGRTGRKRDGRVVCLVSEGQEQKDMMKSKNNERSLQRALRRSDNFKLRPNLLMFPQPPALLKKEVQIMEKLHLSQVGGHAVQERKKDEAPASELVIDHKNWRLTKEKEDIRMSTFGPIHGSKISACIFPVMVRRKLLRARARSCTTACDSARFSQKVLAGASRRLLLTIEATTNDTPPSTGIIRGSKKDRSGLFPMEDSLCPQKNAIIRAGWHECIMNYAKKENEVITREQTDSRAQTEFVHPIAKKKDQGRGILSHFKAFPVETYKAGQGDIFIAQQDRAIHMAKNNSRENAVLQASVQFKLPTPQASSESESEDEEAKTNSNDEQAIRAVEIGMRSGTMTIRLPTPPPSSSESEDDEGEDDKEVPVKMMSRIAAPMTEITDVGMQGYHSDPICPGESDFHHEKKGSEQNPPPTSVGDSAVADQVSDGLIFKLPTQDSSSDDDSDCKSPQPLESSEMLDSTSSGSNVPKICTISMPEQSARNLDSDIHEPTGFLFPKSGSGPMLNVGRKEQKSITMQAATATAFSHESSTDERELIDTPGMTRKEDGAQSVNSALTQNGTPSQIQNGDHHESPNAFSCDEDSPNVLMHKSRTSKMVIMTQDINNTPLREGVTSTEHEELIDTPSVKERTFAMRNPSDHDSIDLVDTPISQKNSDFLGIVDTPVDQTKHVSSRMSETQDEAADDVVCFVCHSGDSSDTDPIVLCDGINGNECEFAVHCSCYSLEPSVISLMDEWRCACCELQQSSKSKEALPTCFVCQESGGAIHRPTRNVVSQWIHPYCMTWSDEDAVVMCDRCSFPGAMKCAFVKCSEAAHPHCVRDVRNDNCWLTVIDTQRKQSQMFCPTHRHESHSGFRWVHDEEESRPPKCFVLPSSRVVALKKVAAKRLPPISCLNVPKQKRLKKKTGFGEDSDNELSDPGLPKEGAWTGYDRRQSVRENLTKRHHGMLNSAFIDSEAIIDSEEDEEGDELAEELRRIDEEEQLEAMGFINDSSQLDYTQDALDKVDPANESTSLHRLIDAENERKRQYATPILNRRIRRPDSQRSDAWGESPSTGGRSSLKGLGNCHFIRSVIEHLREGGDADQIEAVYNEMEQAGQAVEEVVPPARKRKLKVVEYIPSDESDGEAPGIFSEQQKALIERKRLDALARRRDMV